MPNFFFVLRFQLPERYLFFLTILFMFHFVSCAFFFRTVRDLWVSLHSDEYAFRKATFMGGQMNNWVSCSREAWRVMSTIIATKARVISLQDWEVKWNLNRSWVIRREIVIVVQFESKWRYNKLPIKFYMWYRVFLVCSYWRVKLAEVVDM